MSYRYCFGNEKTETFVTISGKDENDCEKQALQLTEYLGGINFRKELEV